MFVFDLFAYIWVLLFCGLTWVLFGVVLRITCLFDLYMTSWGLVFWKFLVVSFGFDGLLF